MPIVNCKKCGTPKELASKCKPCVAAYRKAYYLKNGAADRVATQKWREENADKILEATRKWRTANKEKVAEFHRQYTSDNRDKINAQRRERSKGRRAIKAAQDKAWRERNPDKWNEKNGRYRAVKRGRYRPYDQEFLKLVEEEAFNLCQIRRAMTGISWSVDHMVPLRSKFVSGFHNEFNLNVLPALQNISKGNRYWPDMP